MHFDLLSFVLGAALPATVVALIMVVEAGLTRLRKRRAKKQTKFISCTSFYTDRFNEVR